MNKTTYKKFKAENKAAMKDRRAKAEFRKSHNGIHPDDPQPVHNRASRRQQLGMRRTPARAYKTAYQQRGADHREVVALHREAHAIKAQLISDLHRLARMVRDLG